MEGILFTFKRTRQVIISSSAISPILLKNPRKCFQLGEDQVVLKLHFKSIKIRLVHHQPPPPVFSFVHFCTCHQALLTARVVSFLWVILWASGWQGYSPTYLCFFLSLPPAIAHWGLGDWGQTDCNPETQTSPWKQGVYPTLHPTVPMFSSPDIPQHSRMMLTVEERCQRANPTLPIRRGKQGDSPPENPHPFPRTALLIGCNVT